MLASSGEAVMKVRAPVRSPVVCVCVCMYMCEYLRASHLNKRIGICSKGY